MWGKGKGERRVHGKAVVFVKDDIRKRERPTLVALEKRGRRIGIGVKYQIIQDLERTGTLFKGAEGSCHQICFIRTKMFRVHF